MAQNLVRHRGSLICAQHELRITARCRVDDLDLGGTDLASAEAHPIVRAFVQRRAEHPTGGKTVGPEAGPRTLYHLGTTHDHRGVTWYDPYERVVWLCGHGRHRSGSSDDAFRHFKTLLKDGALRPTEEDYRQLFEDRAHRFAELLPEDAKQLLDHARSSPGREHRARVGGEDEIGVYVEHLETIEETFVTFDVSRMDLMRPPTLLAALYPTAAFAEWDLASQPPHRPLEAGEVCYCILRG